ncbi:hypothetical protein HQ520_15700 [bacterium]|nr:hypothetical protein [bacterium]
MAHMGRGIWLNSRTEKWIDVGHHETELFNEFKAKDIGLSDVTFKKIKKMVPPQKSVDEVRLLICKDGLIRMRASDGSNTFVVAQFWSSNYKVKNFLWAIVLTCSDKNPQAAYPRCHRIILENLATNQNGTFLMSDLKQLLADDASVLGESSDDLPEEGDIENIPSNHPMLVEMRKNDPKLRSFKNFLWTNEVPKETYEEFKAVYRHIFIESSLGRIWQHFQNRNVAILSASRDQYSNFVKVKKKIMLGFGGFPAPEQTDQEREDGSRRPSKLASGGQSPINKRRNDALKVDIRKLGYAFVEVRGMSEEGAGEISRPEISIIAIGPKSEEGNEGKERFKGEMCRLGKKWNQDSILFKPYDNDNAYWIESNSGKEKNQGPWHPSQIGQYFTHLRGRRFTFAESFAGRDWVWQDDRLLLAIINNYDDAEQFFESSTPVKDPPVDFHIKRVLKGKG